MWLLLPWKEISIYLVLRTILIKLSMNQLQESIEQMWSTAAKQFQMIRMVHSLWDMKQSLLRSSNLSQRRTILKVLENTQVIQIQLEASISPMIILAY